MPRVVSDSDGQHDPDEIPVLIKPISEDGCDLVAGSRKLKGSKQKGKRPFIPPLGQFVLKVGLGTITGKGYSNQECEFRALSRRAMDVMNFRGKVFSVEAEMIYLAEKHGNCSISCGINTKHETLNKLLLGLLGYRGRAHDA